MLKQNVAKKSDFDEIYLIMENSFPNDEYRTYEEQKKLLNETDYHIYFIKNNDGIITAFIAFWDLGDFIFIEHFAVTPLLRNSGLGSEFLKEFLKHHNKKTVLEVEKPVSELSKRRIKFYERNAFIFNDYEYEQPPISKGKNKISLKLMTFPLPLTEKEFNDIKTTLYRRVYRAI